MSSPPTKNTSNNSTMAQNDTRTPKQNYSHAANKIFGNAALLQDLHQQATIKASDGALEYKTTLTSDPEIGILGVLVFKPTQLSPSLRPNNDENKNMIDPKSVYGQLPRVSRPRPCKHRLAADDLHEVSSKIWEGDFAALCTICESSFSLLIPFGNNVAGPSKQEDALIINVGKTHGKTHLSSSREWNGGWTQRHQEIMLTQILIHFVRQFGYLLSSWDLLHALHEAISKRFRVSRKGLQDYLDFKMTTWDLSMIHHSEQDFFAEKAIYYLQRICAALDSLQRNQEAGRLLEETAEVYGPKLTNNKVQVQCELYTEAAMNFVPTESKRAEMCYVKALHICSLEGGANWDINSDTFATIVAGVLPIHTELVNGNAGATKENGDVLFPYYFAALVSWMGFKEEHPFFQNWIQFGKDHCRLIKPFFQRADRAKRALQFSLKTGLVQDFKDGILKVVDKEHAFLLKIALHYIEEGIEAPSILKSDKMHFTYEDEQRLYYLRDCDESSCHARETESNTFMQCPCRCVCYCSEACQYADWKKHKKTCIHRIAKKTK